MQAVRPHGRDQEGAPALLRGRVRGACRVAARIEAVEAAAHVEAIVGRALRRRPRAGPVSRGAVERRRWRGGPLDEREINRAAGRMRGMRGLSRLNRAVLMDILTAI